MRSMRRAACGLHLSPLEGYVRALLLVLLLLSTLMLGGCELIGDIFQAGVWVGVILVVLVLAGIAFLAAKLRG